MSVIQCPYCGENTNLPLKFCVSCGRAVTFGDLTKSPFKISKLPDITKRLETQNLPASYQLSKKSYGMQRRLRDFFFACSTLLLLLLVYFITMKFILHSPLPGGMDAALERFAGAPPAPAPMIGPNVSEPAPAPAAAEEQPKTQQEK